MSRPIVVEEISGFGEVPRDMITVSTSISTRNRNYNRTSSSGCIRLAKLHANTFHTFYPAVFVCNEISLGFVRQIKNDSLFFCVMYFFCSCRKLCFTSSVYDMYFSTQTKSSSCSIHCNVTTADNSNFLTVFDRCIMVITKAFIRLLLVRYSFAENTPLLTSPGIPINIGRPAPEPINTASNPSFSISSIDCSGFTDDNVCFNFNAKRFYVFNLFFTTLSFGRRNSGIP